MCWGLCGRHGPSVEGVQKGLGAVAHVWVRFLKGLHRPYLPWWGNLQFHKEVRHTNSAV